MADGGMVKRGANGKYLPGKVGKKKSQAKGSSGIVRKDAPKKRRKRGAGALGMGPVSGVVKRFGIIGGTAVVTKLVSDAAVEKWVMTDETDPKKQALWQGGAQILGGGFLGYMVAKKWPKMRDVGVGIAVGGIAGGGLRIAVAYEWDQTVNDWFSGDETTTTTTTTTTPGATGLRLGQGAGRSYASRVVRDQNGRQIEVLSEAA